MDVKTVALVALSNGSSTWPLDQMSLSRVGIAQGTQRYIDIVGRKSWDFSVEQGGVSIHFHGEQVMDLLATFDTVILWHWPPEHVIETMRRRNSDQRIFVAEGAEAIQTRPPWQVIQRDTWQVLHDYRLRSDTKNRFGGYFVDIYEVYDTPYDKSPHAWAVNMGLEDLPLEYAAVLEESWNAHYPSCKPNGLFMDSVNTRPFYGSATNGPIITSEVVEAYQQGWRNLLYEVAMRIAPPLCHIGGSPLKWPRPLPARQWVSEHFLKNVSTPEVEINKINAEGIDFTIGQDSWQRYLKQDWAQLYEQVDMLDVGIETLRDGLDNKIWYPQ